ncbi:MAG: phosphomannomutase/phosphoglucomutase, partial [Selenomonadales bacterium]|nr:phosphomannomutase/phosphoglucomutase [Selenomonadales bacterium]
IDTLGADGGIMVTASHNSAPNNGFKMVFGSAPITEEDVQEVRRMTEAGEVVRAEGTCEEVAVIESYQTAMAGLAARGKMKVVIDAGGGATSRIAPELFRRCGYDVVELFCDVDPDFSNRPPDPSIPANLALLGEAVRTHGAQLGIGFDGDGDRAGFVDETGRAIDNDKMLVLLAEEFLAKEKGAVIYDAKCSMLVPEGIRKAGGRAVMARAGHTFCKSAFQRENAVFAGELSGHFFFRELGHDDGMFAGLKMCEIVEKHGSLAKMADRLPSYILTDEYRVKADDYDMPKTLDDIAERLADYQPNRIDGVRIETEDGWGMVRASVTQPIFTLRFEGKTDTFIEEMKALFLSAMDETLAERVREAFAAGEK